MKQPTPNLNFSAKLTPFLLTAQQIESEVKDQPIWNNQFTLSHQQYVELKDELSSFLPICLYGIDSIVKTPFNAPECYPWERAPKEPKEPDTTLGVYLCISVYNHTLSMSRYVPKYVTHPSFDAGHVYVAVNKLVEYIISKKAKAA